VGFVLKYCDVCHKRIPEEDFSTGEAVEWNGRTFCKLHVPPDVRAALAQQQEAALRKPTLRRQRKTASSSRLIAAQAARKPSTPVLSHRKSSPPPRRYEHQNAGAEAYPSKKSPLPIIITLLSVVLLVLVVVIVVLMSSQGKNNHRKNPTAKNGTTDTEKTKTYKTIKTSVKTKTGKTHIKPVEIDPVVKKYNAWKATFVKILKDYKNYIDNFDTPDEKQHEIAEKNYPLALKLEKQLKTDEALKKKIPNDYKRKLTEAFIREMGEILADPKKAEVLKKVNALVKKYEYQNAINYLEEVLAGKREQDYPKRLLNEELYSYKSLKSKKKELVRIYTHNKNLIEANKKFLPIEQDVKEFTKSHDSLSPTKEDWDTARDKIEKVLNFKENNEDVYAIEKGRFRIRNKIDDALSTLAEYGYYFYKDEIGKLKQSENKDEIKKYLDKFNTDSALETLKRASEDYYNSLQYEIKRLKARYEELVKKSLPQQTNIAQMLRNSYQQEIAILNQFINKTKLTAQDTLRTGEVLAALSAAWQAKWLVEVSVTDKKGEIKLKSDAFEQKILRWLVQTSKSADFNQPQIKAGWRAWCVLFSLFYPPGESSTGSKIKRLFEKYANKITANDLANAWVILKGLCDRTKFVLAKEMSNIWSAAWEFVNKSIKKMREFSARGETAPENLANAMRESNLYCRSTLLTFAKNTNLVLNVKIAKNTKQKNDILIAWYKKYIPAAERQGANVEGFKKELDALKRFNTFLETYIRKNQK